MVWGPMGAQFKAGEGYSLHSLLSKGGLPSRWAQGHFEEHGRRNVKVKSRHSPAWETFRTTCSPLQLVEHSFKNPASTGSGKEQSPWSDPGSDSGPATSLA